MTMLADTTSPTSTRRPVATRGGRRGPMQPSLPFSGRTPTARACSMKAAIDAAGYRAEKTRKVLEIVRDARAHGLTDHDIRALTGYERSSICSIRDGLVKAGLVVDAQRSRLSGPWKKDCTVWVATEYAGTLCSCAICEADADEKRGAGRPGAACDEEVVS